MKRNRKQYKRTWAAASRTLNNIVADISSDSDEYDINFPELTFDNTYFQNKESENDQAGPSSQQYQNDSPVPEPSSNVEGGQNLATGFYCSTPSESDDSESDAPSDSALKIDLVNWSNQFLVKQNALDGLLSLLKQNCHPNLPSSARSLLQTPRKIPVQMKSGMEYVYFNLADQILKLVKLYPADVIAKTDHIELSLNVDGLPLFKSSGKSLWPVLCAIVNLQPVTVFPVVLTYGTSKPKDSEYLKDVIHDFCHVLEHGLHDGNKCFSIHLRCIVCDAPARVFVKGTKLCSGYFGCDKCIQSGIWLGRVVYDKIQDLHLRTDSFFRNQTQKEHHQYKSEFCALPIDMVRQFPVDYMHQLCLGVVKKLLTSWMRGSRGIKLSAGQCEAITAKLYEVKPFIPRVFVRKPRSLSEIDRWKATEFRQFLLYTGMLVLHGVLKDELYQHFLCLAVASRIMISSQLSQKYLNYAQQLMEYFVQQAEVLYGREFLVYNVHSMLHLAGEVQQYGSLDACSAFVFENYMQHLKRPVRSGKRPIVQIAKCPLISEYTGYSFLTYQK